VAKILIRSSFIKLYLDAVLVVVMLAVAVLADAVQVVIGAGFPEAGAEVVEANHHLSCEFFYACNNYYRR